MENSSQISNEICSSAVLQEYLDGELALEGEILLEQHLANCPSCLDELNLQKSMLGILDQAIEPEIPNDFAEVVAIKAESQVTGLRRKRERVYALVVAAFLVLIVGVLLAFDLSQPFGLVQALIGKLAAFVVMIGSIIANIAIGFYVIAKVFAQQADRQTAMLVFAVTLAVSGTVLWAIRTGKNSPLEEIKR